MNFADNLKKIRKEQNLSQEQIAERLGVSRQSVSKWESGQAYPEMDKMIQLCQMFNLNIDELLNQDIKELNSNKQAKTSLNKFIDDFLGYITKTIDMLSSMSFKEKIKCIFEQLIIMIVIGTILLLIGIISAIACAYLLAFLPNDIYSKVLYILGAIYILFSLMLGIVLMIHIFKVRYLDYYVISKKIVQNESAKDLENHDIRETRKVILEKKIEKVVIRDPNHSGDRFVTSIIKGIISVIKLFTCFIGFLGCISLLSLVICLVLSFLIIKTGVFFVGIFIGLIAIITLNLLVITCLYNFVVNKKLNKRKIGIIGILSIIMCGVGIGISLIGITQFDIINNIDSNYYIEKTIKIDMDEDLFIYDASEYIVSDIDDIEIVVKYSPLYEVNKETYGNGIYINRYLDTNNLMKSVRMTIDDLNKKQIIDYSNYKIYVYANEKNIETLKNNLHGY